MLLHIDIETKTIGNKELFNDLHFSVEANEKVAIIGRNGVGKTTLFQILAGQDNDYAGNMQTQHDVRLVSTAQEHHHVSHEPVIEYILHNLPEYKRLKHVIDTYPDTMGDNLKQIEVYSNALARFSDLGYYNIENEVLQSLESYQISEAMARAPMARLSGGQKRFIELTRVEHANADIALIDEPTNHMDYAAKDVFIKWFKAAKQTVLIITHDRDVLQWADKIIELKDGKALVFKGNYEAYLQQNAVTAATGIHGYEIGLKTLDNLHRKIMWARARKPSWHGTADQRNPFEVMERRLQREYDEIKRTMVKPSFWVDRESAENLPKKVSDSYHKFKAKNIRIQALQGAGQSTNQNASPSANRSGGRLGNTGNTGVSRTASANASQIGSRHVNEHVSELLHVEDVQLGYGEQPLFEPVNFRLQHGQRLRLVGRNGVGKTTLVQTILSASQGTKPATLLSGKISCGSKLRLSIYEQELAAEVMTRTLAEAIEQIYTTHDLAVNDQITKGVMGDYLFDPHKDGHLTVGQLSGGQKARLQLIKLLAGNPNLLILDEPTNHLDLPSIEELENALKQYHGALIYVSHDSYFAKNIGGEACVLQRAHG